MSVACSGVEFELFICFFCCFFKPATSTLSRKKMVTSLCDGRGVCTEGDSSFILLCNVDWKGIV